MKVLKRDLFVKKSTLPGAGLGLFTKVEIKKGTSIVEYKGRLVAWREIKGEDGYNGYILRVSRSKAINALPYKKALGRFANDACGITRKKGLRNNAEYVVYDDRCFIEAITDIKKGQEIFVTYGGEYWRLIRKIRKRLVSLPARIRGIIAKM